MVIRDLNVKSPNTCLHMWQGRNGGDTKLSLCLIKHEDVQGRGGTIQHIPDLGSLMFWPLYNREKCPLLLDRKLTGPHSWCGRYGIQNIDYLYRESNPESSVVQPVACFLYARYVDFSASRAVQCWMGHNTTMTQWENERKRSWAILRYCVGFCIRGTKDKRVIFQDSLCPMRDLNPWPF
jgi:hypothetical protein